MTPTMIRVTPFHLALGAVGSLLDAALLEARLDGGQGSPELVDLIEQPPRGRLELVGERLDEVAAAERIGRVRDASLVGQDLLRPQGQSGRLLSRQRQRLVPRVRVQALGSAQDRGEGLDGGPHDVVVDRPCGQRGSRRLNVKTACHRTNVRCTEPLAHDPGPHPTGGPELGDLLEELAPGGEEEAQAAGKGVNVQATLDGRFDVGDRIGQRERQLLGRRRPRLAHVVAADADRVPAGQLARGRTRRRR